ncbi:MAG TPA: protoporphyrinogen oxidase, partial [Deltaproteobacteria bacterium]|nr:protoporphyrinogen oxidase [Deltaproteobacteria bacterium]
MLIVPTKFRPFLFSPLISLPGKLRMGLDWFIKPKTDGADETLADFIRRRLGPEALDKIAEPLLAGIYNADTAALNVLPPT